MTLSKSTPELPHIAPGVLFDAFLSSEIGTANSRPR